MIKPTPEQVEAYAKTIGFKIDGEAFCDYYEIGGWIYGKNRTPIKSWQACVRTWKRYDKRPTGKKDASDILKDALDG